MSYTIEQLENCVETATRDLRREIQRLRQELADTNAELLTQARLAIQRRAALEQIRDYHVIQGLSPALFAEKVLGSSDNQDGSV